MTVRVVIMGVAGSGKSSVGEALSKRTGIVYRDGDELHPAENIAKMAAGLPLGDDDRWLWLDRVGHELAHKAPIIVGCSALRRVYRDRIRARAGPVRFIYLEGSRKLIAARMAARSGHYMPLSLLDSQFAALEVPDAFEALTVSIEASLDNIVEHIAAALNKETA